MVNKVIIPAITETYDKRPLKAAYVHASVLWQLGYKDEARKVLKDSFVIAKLNGKPVGKVQYGAIQST